MSAHFQYKRKRPSMKSFLVSILMVCPHLPNQFHPQAIQDVDEFVSALEQIWRNLALNHLLTSGSSAVNGCRQNESPNR